jgi:hypothetical protein
VVLFLRPVATYLLMVGELLQLFGSAAGLKTNIQKVVFCQFNALGMILQ